MEDNNKQWYKLALGMTILFGSYITSDLLFKIRDQLKKKQKLELKKQNKKKQQKEEKTPQQRQMQGKNENQVYMNSPVQQNRIVQGVTIQHESMVENQIMMDFVQNDQQLKSDFILNKSQKRIQKIVFTGGPCAGKTSAIAYCAELLRDRGFKVLIVPEAATQLNIGGAMINMSKFTEEMIIKFQSCLMKLQMNLEDRFTEMALIDKEVQQTVILCDRGVMDGSAYMSPLNWQALLDEMTLNTIILRDRRYDAVIHLVTAADGAHEFYNLDNPSRYEKDIEIAKQVDNNLRNSWHGHPYWYLITNKECSNFNEKLRKTGEAILHLVGLPSSLVFYKKYLLQNISKSESALQLIPQDINKEIMNVEDTFLNKNINSTRECRIRRRGQNDSYTYLYFETKTFAQGKQSEIRKRINAREYIDLMQQRDHERQTIIKTRCVFFWNNENYILEEHKVRNLTFCLLIIQREDDKMEYKLNLPDFIQSYIVRDVSDDEQYSPSNLSTKDWYMPQEDFNKALPELQVSTIKRVSSINNLILPNQDNKQQQQ